MMQTMRLFLFGEASTFVVAALIHRGVLFGGYQHRDAAIAESVIGTVLLAGLALTWIRPQAFRAIAIAAQGFALLGTLVGIFTIVVGVGPRTVPDVVYHVAIVMVLASGLNIARRVVSY
jgi:hypothetical protein